MVRLVVLGLWTCGRVSGDWVVRVGWLRAHAPNGLQAIHLSLTPGRRFAWEFCKGSCVAYRSNGIRAVRLPLPIWHPLLGVGGPHSGRRVPWERRIGVGSRGPRRSTALSDMVDAVVSWHTPRSST